MFVDDVLEPVIAIYVTTFYFTLQFFVPRVDMISEAKPRKLCNPRTIKL